MATSCETVAVPGCPVRHWLVGQVVQTQLLLSVVMLMGCVAAAPLLFLERMLPAAALRTTV